MEPQEQAGSKKRERAKQPAEERRAARFKLERAEQRKKMAVFWFQNTTTTLLRALERLNSPQADFNEYHTLIFATDSSKSLQEKGEIMRDFVAKGMAQTDPSSDLRGRFLAIQSGIEAKIKELQEAESNLAIASENARKHTRR